MNIEKVLIFWCFTVLAVTTTVLSDGEVAYEITQTGFDGSNGVYENEMNANSESIGTIVKVTKKPKVEELDPEGKNFNLFNFIDNNLNIKKCDASQKFCKYNIADIKNYFNINDCRTNYCGIDIPNFIKTVGLAPCNEEYTCLFKYQPLTDLFGFKCIARGCLIEIVKLYQAVGFPDENGDIFLPYVPEKEDDAGVTTPDIGITIKGELILDNGFTVNMRDLLKEYKLSRCDSNNDNCKVFFSDLRRVFNFTDCKEDGYCKLDLPEFLKFFKISCSDINECQSKYNSVLTTFGIDCIDNECKINEKRFGGSFGRPNTRGSIDIPQVLDPNIFKPNLVFDISLPGTTIKPANVLNQLNLLNCGQGATSCSVSPSAINSKFGISDCDKNGFCTVDLVRFFNSYNLYCNTNEECKTRYNNIFPKFNIENDIKNGKSKIDSVKFKGLFGKIQIDGMINVTLPEPGSITDGLDINNLPVILSQLNAVQCNSMKVCSLNWPVVKSSLHFTNCDNNYCNFDAVSFFRTLSFKCDTNSDCMSRFPSTFTKYGLSCDRNTCTVDLNRFRNAIGGKLDSQGNIVLPNFNPETIMSTGSKSGGILDLPDIKSKIDLFKTFDDRNLRKCDSNGNNCRYYFDDILSTLAIDCSGSTNNFCKINLPYTFPVLGLPNCKDNNECQSKYSKTTAALNTKCNSEDKTCLINVDKLKQLVGYPDSLGFIYVPNGGINIGDVGVSGGVSGGITSGISGSVKVNPSTTVVTTTTSSPRKGLFGLGGLLGIF